MKIRLSCLLLLASASTATYAADCVYPREPTTVPNGQTATKEEMLTGTRETKEYNAQVTVYLACLDEKMNTDIANAGPDAAPEVINQIKAINAKRHNAAIEALEAYAARFNQEVRAFKSRDKEKS